MARKRSAPEVTHQRVTNEAGEVIKEVMTSKGRGIDLRITTTWDRELGIEYAEIVSRRHGRSYTTKLKRDIATGKMLPGEDAPTLRGALDEEYAQVAWQYIAAADDKDKKLTITRTTRKA